MKTEQYKQLIDARKMYPKEAMFVIMLIDAKIPLDCIDTNDFSCNTMPSVYVHNKKNRFAMRRYHRCAVSDVVKAYRFFKTDGKITKTK